MALMFSAPATSQDAVRIQNGYITGRTYLNMPASAKASYVTGLVDGMILSPLLADRVPGMAWLVQCVSSKPGSQLSAMLTKKVEDDPGQWDKPAHTQFYSTLLEACPRARP